MYTTMTESVLEELHASDQLSQCTYSIAIAALVSGPQQAACLEWLQTYAMEAEQITAGLSWQNTYITSYATALALRVGGMTMLSDGILAALSANRNTTTNTETLTFGGLVGALNRFSQRTFGFVMPHSPAVQSAVEAESYKWQKVIQWNQFYNPIYSIAGFTAESSYGLPIDLDRFTTAFGLSDGSIARSASASAITLLNYLAQDRTPPCALVNYVHQLNPYERTIGVFDQLPNFLNAWTLMYADLDDSVMRNLPEAIELRDALAQTARIGAAGNLITPELDTGSVAMLGIRWPRAERQRAFEEAARLMFDGTVYRTFLFERNPSVSTNIHVLAAWPENPHADAIFGWLQQELDGTFDHWLCKWHISPFYVIGEIGRLMIDIPHPIAQRLAVRALYMLLAAQRTDGGWGIVRSTTEETAYAVLALRKLHDCYPALAHECDTSLLNARAVLERSPDYTPLWIGKSLYCLRPLVRVLQSLAREALYE